MSFRLTLSAILALGCVTMKVAAQQSVSYASQVKPFFATYCMQCHSSHKAKAGLVLDTFQGLGRGSDNGPVVVPGKPDEGALVLVVEGKSKPVMPPRKAAQPRPEEVALLRAWVATGAREDVAKGDAVVAEANPNQPPVAPAGRVPDDRRQVSREGRDRRHEGREAEEKWKEHVKKLRDKGDREEKEKREEYAKKLRKTGNKEGREKREELEKKVRELESKIGRDREGDREELLKKIRDLRKEGTERRHK